MSGRSKRSVVMMDGFLGMLGLLVLGLPYLMVLIWIPVCIWLALWTSRKFIKKSMLLKITGGFAVFLLVLILPFADEIVGRIYFNQLCETEAGVKVYQTIELPAEYWDKDGKPKFYNERNGNLILPINSVEWESRKEKYPLHVEKNSSLMKEKSTGKELNERTLFRYWGGWIARNFSPHNTAISCGGDVTAYSNYVSQIFKPEKLGWKGDK